MAVPEAMADRSQINALHINRLKRQAKSDHLMARFDDTLDAWRMLLLGSTK